MGLFVKKETPLNTPSYSVSLAGHTKLIVGLGNPGLKYAKTRHNAGFLALDAFALQQGFPEWKDNGRWKVHLSEQNLFDKRVILLKPQTFMNNSGSAVAAVIGFYKLGLGDVLVISDDKDMPFGQIRTRVGGSSGGHNGLKSLIDHLGEDFARIRIGVANEHTPAKDTADFVLDQFTHDEQQRLALIKREAGALVGEWLAGSKLLHDTRSID